MTSAKKIQVFNTIGIYSQSFPKVLYDTTGKSFISLIRGAMVRVVINGNDDPSSKSGQGCLHFT